MSLRPRSWTPLLLLGLLAAQGISLVISGLRLNLTGSLPLGLYRLTPGEPDASDLVVACLPEAAGRLGRERGYLPTGKCPGGAAPVLKRVGAVGGETVVATAALPRVDTEGRPLRPFPTPLLLAEGQLWLVGEHPRSWDSRFFGPVDSVSVRGIARPLWTPRGSAGISARGNQGAEP